MIDADSQQAALKALQEYRASLLTELERIRADIEAIDRAIGRLSGQPGLGVVAQAGLGYVGLMPQAAVERFLREHPGEKLRATQIARHLLNLGMEKRGVTFTSAIIAALHRAVHKGIALSEVNAKGKKVYYLTESS